MIDKEKDVSYAKVYTELLLDPVLNDSAAIIYGILVSRCYSDTSTYVSNKKITELTGKSDSVVKKSIKLLEQEQYIKIVGSHNGRKIFPKHLTPDLTEVVKTPNTRVFTESQHKYMEACLTHWGERVQVGEFTRVAGAQHKLKPLGVGQSKTVWRIFQYLQDASQGNLFFYDKYIDKMSPSWVEKTGISRERVAHSNKNIKDVLKIHLDLLKEGVEKENFRKLPNSLEHLFIQTQKAPDNKNIVSSWFLYWLCKDDIIAEQKSKAQENTKPLTPKYPEEKNLYRAVGKAFGVNWNKLEKTPTELNNKVITLAEYIQEELVVKRNTEMKHRGQFPVNHMFREGLTEFLSSKSGVHNFNPLQFIPGRAMWNQMIDYFKFKVHQEEHKHFELFYHPVKEFKVNQNTL